MHFDILLFKKIDDIDGYLNASSGRIDYIDEGISTGILKLIPGSEIPNVDHWSQFVTREKEIRNLYGDSCFSYFRDLDISAMNKHFDDDSNNKHNKSPVLEAAGFRRYALDFVDEYGSWISTREDNTPSLCGVYSPTVDDLDNYDRALLEALENMKGSDILFAMSVHS